MREIKFRGLTIKNKWIYGYFIKQGSYFFIQNETGGNDVVIKNSVSQYTGLKDKNGIEIYEGDILICHEYDGSDCMNKITQTFKNAVVGFYSGNYYFYPKGNMNQPHQLLMYAYNSEIKGNIHENPELLCTSPIHSVK